MRCSAVSLLFLAVGAIAAPKEDIKSYDGYKVFRVNTHGNKDVEEKLASVYGQYILSPFGYKETLYAPELGKWTKASALVSEAIRDSSEDRTTFTFGPSGAVLYVTTGAAPDHVYSVGEADFSYTIELRDNGQYGFVLPPEQIRPNVVEQWAGQKVLLSLLDEEFFDGQGAALYQGQS
ncbi:hypothetical protein F66182_9017 [Fusarium sp. NRRL 66182]|nr:hypothetical protein F66182_9017 [Fusarium sp. NRRL 66182]